MKQKPHLNFLLMLKKFTPFILLVIVIITDLWGSHGFSLAPLASSVLLFFFASYMSFRWMVIWSAIYVTCVILILWNTAGLWTGGTGNASGMLVSRSLGAITAGSMACLFARLREKESASRSEVRRLLGNLSIPTITSDENGWIIHMNEHALALFGDEPSLGKPFFAYFQTLSEKGRSIQRYLDLVEGKVAGPISFDLVMPVQQNQAFSPILMRLNVNGKRCILTILYPSLSK